MENQTTNLFTVIRLCDSKTACDLIDKDPTLVGAITRERISVMTYAIQAGNLAVVNKLLEHHAEVTEEHFHIASQNKFADILQALEENTGISNELYSDGEYDELSSEEEEELRKTPLCHTNLHSLFTETETPSYDTNALRTTSAPPTLQTTAKFLRNVHPTFARVISDASADHISEQLRNSTQSLSR